MNAITKTAESHPHFVHIPDPQQTEGVRAYHEPDQPHPLQLAFLDPAAERAWIEETARMLSEGRADEAAHRITAELEGFDGRLARLCRQATSATLEGWEDLLPILSEWEGPAITAITIGLTNLPDLVFDGGAAPEPELLIGLYSDESFGFSSATKAEILNECGKELPAWSGAEEDVEFYCAVTGLAELNGALINWKHRHFLRDGRDGVEGRAPGGYVEYVLASWFVAARFLQAVNQAISHHGAPSGCRIIAGTLELNADFVAVLGADKARRANAATVQEPSFATLTVKPWVRGEEIPAEPIEPVPTLRQRVQAVEPVEEPKSFVARLFGRFRRR